MATVPYVASNVAYGPDKYLRDEVSVGGPLTALAGGAKPGTLTTGTLNLVDTVATAADSVSIHVAATPGASIFIHNSAANAMQVFGLGTDTINSVATATGVSQAAAKSARYTCIVAGNWIRTLSA